jgi:hypothetical protein
MADFEELASATADRYPLGIDGVFEDLGKT